MQRVDLVCDFFKDSSDPSSLRKRKSDKTTSIVASQKGMKSKVKSKIQKDEQGNIIFPVKISGNLTLVSPGEIKPLPAFQSDHNLFPVGYKSERIYQSMFEKGKKALYTCEILDGGDRPIFKVTSSEDPDNPIIRDTTTACWVHICKLIDNLAET